MPQGGGENWSSSPVPEVMHVPSFKTLGSRGENSDLFVLKVNCNYTGFGALIIMKLRSPSKSI